MTPASRYQSSPFDVHPRSNSTELPEAVPIGGYTVFLYVSSAMGIRSQSVIVTHLIRSGVNVSHTTAFLEIALQYSRSRSTFVVIYICCSTGA